MGERSNMSYIKNSLPDYDEVRNCVQEFCNEIMNFEDKNNGILKPGFVTPEFVKELEEHGLDIREYDQDYIMFWIDGHEITVEAKYYPVGPGEMEAKWEITE
jgi:hypothetical protein